MRRKTEKYCSASIATGGGSPRPVGRFRPASSVRSPRHGGRSRGWCRRRRFANKRKFSLTRSRQTMSSESVKVKAEHANEEKISKVNGGRRAASYYCANDARGRRSLARRGRRRGRAGPGPAREVVTASQQLP